jgi:Tol biopolymer transport system component
MKLSPIVLFFFLMAWGQSLHAQTGSEIYIADLEITESGISLSNPKNITNRIGYDNQPSFHPSKHVLYYSSFNEDERSDIKIFNYKNGKTEHFTQTQEREYSPTVTPDDKFISCIIQRDDGAQDLGKYPIKGGSPIILINNLIVGYHAWINPTQIALFVLGTPLTLRVYNLETKTDSIITSSIGRSLHKIPNSNSFSFVDKSSAQWKINSWTNGNIETIIETLPAREDLTWTPDGKIITSDGRQFFFYDPQKEDGQWQMFYASDIKGVSRLAASPDGKKIAFVVAE